MQWQRESQKAMGEYKQDIKPGQSVWRNFWEEEHLKYEFPRPKKNE